MPFAMNTISVKIPEQLDKALSRVAASRGLSKSTVIREACGEYLSQQPSVQTIPSLLEQMGDDIVGAISGPGDLSTNPDYLNGYGQ